MTYSGWKGGENYKIRRASPRQASRKAHHPRRARHGPKNRLGRVLMTKLKVYKGDKHPHSAQQPAALDRQKVI